jgi:hypothetical protein
MKAGRAGLVLAFVAFAAWIGWLGWQALTVGRFPVLSRAQLLVSTHDVIASVPIDARGDPADTVTVQEVHWPKDGGGLKLGDRIRVVNLGQATGFTEPGLYILPLVAGEKPGEFRIAGIPPSPGFPPAGPFLIYPLTQLTREQLASIPKSQGDAGPAGVK